MTWKPLNPQVHEEDPPQLGSSLDRLSRSLGAASGRSLQTVFSRWAEVVGEPVAANVRPSRLRDGILVVEVSNPSWATEVRWLAPQILARLSAAAGEEVATEVQVRVAGGRSQPLGPSGSAQRG